MNRAFFSHRVIRSFFPWRCERIRLFRPAAKDTMQADSSRRVTNPANPYYHYVPAAHLIGKLNNNESTRRSEGTLRAHHNISTSQSSYGTKLHSK